MDGENNGKPCFQMDDIWGKTPLFLETSISFRCWILEAEAMRISSKVMSLLGSKYVLREFGIPPDMEMGCLDHQGGVWFLGLNIWQFFVTFLGYLSGPFKG